MVEIRRRHRANAVKKRGQRSLRSEEHTSELQSQSNLVCRLLLEKKKSNAHSLSLRVTKHVHSTIAKPACLSNGWMTVLGLLNSSDVVPTPSRAPTGTAIGATLSA